MTPLNCEWVIAGKMMSCVLCGRPVPLINDSRGIVRSCRGERVTVTEVVQLEPSGLGDRIESALTTLGITKDRVEQWVGQPCGCAERREKLNRLGEWASAAVSRGKDWAAGRLRELIG